MEEKKIDFLIIGAGLAGTTLALELLKRRKTVAIIDAPKPNSSSRVAAGIINPVVPKGITTTWKIEDMFPQVFEYYQQWESIFGESFIQRWDFITLHKNQEEFKQWEKRHTHPTVESWIESTAVPDWLPEEFNHGASNTRCAGRLQVNQFLELAKNYLINQGVTWLLDEVDNIDDFNSSHFENKLLSQFKYNSIVFCQGAYGTENPLFPNLFFDPTEGDILTVKIIGLPQQTMLKRGLWLVPLAKDIWLAGSNFIKAGNASTSETETIQALLDQLAAWIPFNIELIDHKRGKRPTVQNRRPYLGKSPLPDKSNCYIYNGLGSKGSSLCSWLSPMMADFLTTHKPLDPEVDIQRFYL